MYISNFIVYFLYSILAEFHTCIFDRSNYEYICEIHTYVTSERGQPILVKDDHTYSKDRINNYGVTLWKCVNVRKRNCLCGIQKINEKIVDG